MRIILLKVFCVILSVHFISCELLFPFKEFFNFTKQHISDFKFSDILCRYNSYPSGCSCENACTRRNDCCIDKFWSQVQPMNLSTYIDFFVDKMTTAAEKRMKLKQVPLITTRTLKKSYLVGSEYINAITSCPDTATREAKRLCESTDAAIVDSILPVEDGESFYYRNKFCAECNQVQSYHNVHVQIHCATRSLDNFTLITNKTNCWFSRSKHDSFIIRQFPHVRRCGRSRYNSFCSIYKGVIGSFYNYHCALCNGYDESNIITVPISFPVTVSTKWSKIISLRPSFMRDYVEKTVRKSSGLSTQITKQRFEISYCKRGQVLDIAQDKCVDYLCAYGYTKTKGRCVKREINISVGNFSLLTHTLLNSSLLVCIKTTRNVSLELMMPTFTNVSRDGMEDTTTFTVRNVKHLEETINSLLKLNSTQNSIQNIFVSTTNGFGRNMFDVFPSGKRCAISEQVEVTDVNFTRKLDIILQNKTIEYKDIKPLITIAEGKIARLVKICRHYYLSSNCPLKKLTNYVISGADKKLTVVNSSRILSVNQYVPFEDGVAVCIETGINLFKRFYTKPSWLRKVNATEAYTTLCGTILSLLSYIFVIKLFIRRSMNVPKQLITTLCCTLLISDSVFLLSNVVSNNKIACKGVAIALHTFLLLSHFIAATIAYEFSSTFKIKMVNKPIVSFKRFINYIIFSVSMSVLIVATTNVLNEFHVVDVKYGVNGECWIASLYGRVFAYIVPAICVYLFSIVALLYALHNIHVVTKLSNIALNKVETEKHRSGRIAFKLVVYLGIIEIFGLIQISKHNLSNNELIFNSVFQMLFTIIRSFRGVFICTLVSRKSWFKRQCT
ncbi:uncharacterized protein LOC130654519 [Hydractinia symbiolongicarpus]|uniref:uncharacterized protein LOC130654519 n=1 Tax=Hydractinia symbiolongicarpus TaxID=13093 RepID=UPI0025513530|nr:uncharacterized protein LOC130654519 [Hydractinia symbiolongicarpus]